MYAPESDEPIPMTEAEYLAFADEQDLRYEFRSGQIYAMSGGTYRHSRLIANTITHLSIGLDETECEVTSESTRVHIASKSAYRYPDTDVVCGGPEFLEGREDTITNPALLVEVLSPSTEVIDRNEKLEEYTAIPTLQAYVLISQDRPKVEVYRRGDDNKWLYEFVTGLDATIDVPFAGEILRIELAAVYRRVGFDDEQFEGD